MTAAPCNSAVILIVEASRFTCGTNVTLLFWLLSSELGISKLGVTRRKCHDIFIQNICVTCFFFSFWLMLFVLSFQKNPVFATEIDHQRFKSLPAISSRVSDLSSLEVCMRTNKLSCFCLLSLFTGLSQAWVRSHHPWDGPLSVCLLIQCSLLPRHYHDVLFWIVLVMLFLALSLFLSCSSSLLFPSYMRTSSPLSTILSGWTEHASSSTAQYQSWQTWSPTLKAS